MDDMPFRARLKWKWYMLGMTLKLVWAMFAVIPQAFFEGLIEGHREIRAERKKKTRACVDLGCTPGWQIGRVGDDLCVRCASPVTPSQVETQLKQALEGWV
jgi:hypothetical protein